MNQWTQSRVVEPKAFGNYATRMKHFGLTARAYQNRFTVACALTHRRAWELMVAQNRSIALIFEHDARSMVSNAEWSTHDAIANVSAVDSRWDILQLGRCWDFCSTTKNTTNTGIVTSVSPGCSHAYVLTREGASTLLRYSLPHITSVDFLFAVLHRTHRLRMYSVTPLIWTQYREIDSHDTRPMEECDVLEPTFANYTTDRRGDLELLRTVEDHWISSFLTVSPPIAITKLCVSECRIITGNLTANRPIADVLRQFDALQIRSVFVWDSIATIDPSHVHARMYRTMEHILSRSIVPIRLCQLKRIRRHACSILHDTQYRTLFISSTWSLRDYPPAMYLPVIASGLYLFHGVVPPRFEHLRHAGRLVQWHVHDMRRNPKFLDSQLYALRALHSYPPTITSDRAHRFYQSTWAALPSIEKIRARSTAISHVYYDGPIHKENLRVFCRFVTGCHAENVRVYRTGPHIKVHIPCRAFFSDQPGQKNYTTNTIVPIIQPDEYIDNIQTYIPVYAFDAFAANLEIMTNNPHIPLMFKDFRREIHSHFDASMLCRTMRTRKKHKLQHQSRLGKRIRLKHTYTNRLTNILELFDR